MLVSAPAAATGPSDFDEFHLCCWFRHLTDGHNGVRGATSREQRERDAALVVEGRIRDLDMMDCAEQVVMLVESNIQLVYHKLWLLLTCI